MSPTPVVLVVGSLHHDIMIEADHLPRKDETAVGTRWYPKFGGKGGNQAAAARRAGVGARMFGAVGRDAFGAYLTAALDAAQVDRRFVAEVSDAGSGMSVAVQDADGDYAATIVSGANLLLDPGALVSVDLWQDVRVLVLQNEVPDAMNVAAAREARKRGVKVVLNAAPARALSDDLRRNVDLLVVNAVEAEMMGAAPVEDLHSALEAAHHLAAGFESVVVTAGSQGLAAWTQEDERLSLPATKVKAVSSHGAGDCFTGTVAAALASGRSLRDACIVGSAAAAAHVAGTSGAGPA